MRLVRATGSQCTVTWVLSMSDTRRFRGAVLGPGEQGTMQYLYFVSFNTSPVNSFAAP